MKSTNPAASSLKTGEFWFAGGSVTAILAIAGTIFNVSLDVETSEALGALITSAIVGLGSILGIALVARTVFIKKVDLKTALIEHGYLTNPAPTEVTPPVVETPVVEQPVTPPSETVPVA